MARTETARSQNLAAFALDNIVEVKVGPDLTKFYVHRALLAEHSGYVHKALNEPWKQAEGGIVLLPEIGCGIFGIVVNWIYTKHNTIDQACMAMLEATALEDRFQAPTFQRAVQRKFVDFTHSSLNSPAYEVTNYTFANLASSNPDLDLLFEMHCCYFNEEADTEENGELARRDQLPHEFLIRVMLRFSHHLLRNTTVKN